ncbi:hypothetical protein K440DRAFT_299487 [Wilcoxina mikolae CBS 423.85]|nr:hypothetical protein K440DRAFT_299487 [Wilcoxina mikolae CBS 423.85]
MLNLTLSNCTACSPPPPNLQLPPTSLPPPPPAPSWSIRVSAIGVRFLVGPSKKKLCRTTTHSSVDDLHARTCDRRRRRSQPTTFSLLLVRKR